MAGVAKFDKRKNSPRASWRSTTGTARLALPTTPAKSGGFPAKFVSRNPFAVEAQAAGSSIGFVYEQIYPKFEDRVTNDMLLDTVVPRDIRSVVTVPSRALPSSKRRPQRPLFSQ